MPNRRVNSNLLFGQTEAELKKYLESSFTESLRQLIRVTVKTMIKVEMEEFRKEMRDLVGVIHFNGTYPRQLMGPLGTIENIPVPRFRDNPTPFIPETMGVFGEEKDKFMGIITEMHRLGISQRKIKQLAATCFKTTISANRVGTVYKVLADQESAQVNTLPLTDDYECFMADGLWIKAKGYGWEENKAVILCVLGVKPDGKRTILGFEVVRAETYEAWHDLLLSLKKRGLTGANLKLIVSDDGAGFMGAIKQLFPHVPHQICIVHKMRNVIGKTKYQNRKGLATDLKEAYNQSSRKAFLLKAKSLVKKWYLIEPKAIDSFKHHLLDTTTYFDFDPAIWRRIRTNNILEREFRELRRRIKVMDNSFNDTQSATRYTGSLINYLNQNYPAVTYPKLHNHA
jgi:transposase-like protein